MATEVEWPRDRIGRRWTKSKTPPQPETFEKVVAERNSLRRSLTALTKGLERLEWYAKICAEVNFKDPEAAVRHMRRQVLTDYYDGRPLCEIERLLAKKGNAMMVLACYQLVAKAIERQLTGSVRLGERQDETATSYVSGAP